MGSYSGNKLTNLAFLIEFIIFQIHCMYILGRIEIEVLEEIVELGMRHISESESHIKYG